jgi:hypothetical protein
VDVGDFWEEMEEPYKNVFTEESVPQDTHVHLTVQKTKVMIQIYKLHLVH